MTEISDFQKIAEQYANKIAGNYRTKVEWVCLDGTHPDLKDYPDKLLSFQVNDPVFSWGLPSTHQEFMFHENTPNYGSQTLTTTINRAETKTDTFSWSITEGIKYTSTLKCTVEIFEMSGSYELSLSSTQGESTTTEKSWNVQQIIPVPPQTATDIVWLLNRSKIRGTFTANVVVSGWVAIWFKDKIDLRDPKGNNKHWLWFVTPSSVVSTVGASGYNIQGSQVSYNATGIVNADCGVTSSLVVRETPLKAGSQTNSSTYNFSPQGLLMQETHGISDIVDKHVQRVGISSSPSAMGYNGKLFCFHHGSNNNGQLWYSIFDGTNWAQDRQVQNVGISVSPSAIAYNGKLYCFHQGYNNNGQLWYSVFDGTNWTTDKQIQNVGMSSSPSVVVYNGKLYCFHQGYNNNGQLWYSVFDGTNWAPDKQIQHVGMSSSPAAIVYNGKLYCLHQGSNNNSQLWYCTFDGTNWVDKQVQGVGISDSPAVIEYDGKLCCFHQGSNNNSQLWYSIFDGTNWTKDKLIQHVGMSSSPSATAYNGKLYCFHQGSNNNNQLWYAFSDTTENTI